MTSFAKGLGKIDFNPPPFEYLALVSACSLSLSLDRMGIFDFYLVLYMSQLRKILSQRSPTFLMYTFFFGVRIFKGI